MYVNKVASLNKDKENIPKVGYQISITVENYKIIS